MIELGWYMPVQNAVTSHSEASTHKTEKKTKNSENVIAISKKQLQSIKMEKTTTIVLIVEAKGPSMFLMAYVPLHL